MYSEGHEGGMHRIFLKTKTQLPSSLRQNLLFIFYLLRAKKLRVNNRKHIRTPPSNIAIVTEHAFLLHIHAALYPDTYCPS